MESKIIHKKCNSNVQVFGSTNQSIYKCELCGIVDVTEITTCYKCNCCGKFYLADNGSCNIKKGKQIFECKGCGGEK